MTLQGHRPVAERLFGGRLRFAAPDVRIDDLLVAPLIVVAGPYYAGAGNGPRLRDVRCAKVEVHSFDAARDFGRTIKPGEPVDLDEVLHDGIKIRDVFRVDSFEKVDPVASEI